MDEDAGPTKEALAEWDEHIAELCHDVNVVTDVIIQKHKSWVKTHKSVI